jgi:hypothetical protein
VAGQIVKIIGTLKGFTPVRVFAGAASIHRGDSDAVDLAVVNGNSTRGPPSISTV